ncbi:MAG: glycosyltransferase family 4 protein [Pontibacterium sp.]
MTNETSAPFKKALYVHYQRFERDGSFVHVTNFSREFKGICDEKGIEFKVIAPPLATGVPGQKESGLQKFKSFLARFFISDIKALLVQLKRMRAEIKMLKAEKPDIVLTRFDYNTFSIIWACRALKIPVVLEINSPDHEEREAKYYRVPGAEWFFSSTRALSLCNGGFAVSQVLTEEYRVESTKHLPLKSIPNGVTLSQFTPGEGRSEVRAAHGIDDDAVVVGFVGSFAPWHRMDMLFDSFAKLLSEGNRNVKLLLVGQVKPESESSVARANEPDLKDSVIFSGFVPSDKIGRYLAAMDITVLQNSAYYCSPLKMFEYMAMETAVLASGTGPVKEMLEDGKEGVLFPLEDTQAMTEALTKLVDDASLRQSLGKAARERMAAEFTWRHNAEKVYTLLDEVYSKPKA